MSREIAAPPTRRHSRIGPRSAGLPMTPEEFDRLPESSCQAGYRYELIRGILVVSPSPSISERDPNEELGYMLRAYRDTHPAGSSLDATVPEQTISIGENRRRCDRAIWVGLGRTPDPKRDVPAIVVEFVSASRRDHRRDYEQKRGEYLDAGVVEYWVIDRFLRKMSVYTRPHGEVVERFVLEAESFETPLLPGFVLPLARLLGRADLWPSKKTPRKPTA
jgi:Uma2 family endonuclease